MRRIVAVVAAGALAFGLTACGRQTDTGGAAAGGSSQKGTIGVAMPTKTSERWIKDGDTGLEQFTELLKAGKPHVGRLRPPQLEFLFGGQSEHIASSALVPLGDKGGLGLLAVGSRDADRFSPTLGTAFLTRISELVTAAVQPLMPK